MSIETAGYGIRRAVAISLTPMVLAFVLTFAVPVEGTAQTGTELIADCIEDAADSYADCVDESGGGFSGLVEKALCTVKYAADGILCVIELVK